MNRAALPNPDQHLREQAVVEAAVQVVKSRSRIKSGKGRSADYQRLLLGESTLIGMFPSLSRPDLFKLASVIVDISSWSLRHVLNMPEAVPVRVKDGIPKRVTVEANPQTHVYDSKNNPHPLGALVLEILGDSEMSANEILTRVEARGFKYYSRQKGHHRVGSFRVALRMLDCLQPLKCSESGYVKFMSRVVHLEETRASLQRRSSPLRLHT